MPDTHLRLAFIGLGIMGCPMALNLLKSGHKLRVHTRTKSRASSVLKQGAEWADSPADAAKGADIIFTCVTDTPDVEAVLVKEKGVIESAKKGMIVVDHSTISPSVTKRVAGELARRGVKMIDAPISGGDVGAKNATLSIMCGGDKAAFDRVEPILRCMGKTITYCGESGSGQLTKLVNQILVSVTNMAVSESLLFAKRNGLDLEKTIGAVGGGAAGSWQLENLGPKMIAGDFRPGFMIDLQQKDLRLVLEAAAQANVSLPAASLVHQLFTAAQAAGHGKHGTQALFSVFEKLASLH